MSSFYLLKELWIRCLFLTTIRFTVSRNTLYLMLYMTGLQALLAKPMNIVNISAVGPPIDLPWAICANRRKQNGDQQATYDPITISTVSTPFLAEACVLIIIPELLFVLSCLTVKDNLSACLEISTKILA